MYSNTLLRRQIGRYLRTLPDKGLTDRYICAIRATLLKFHDHCVDHGTKCADKVDREAIISFIEKYSLLSASHQRQTACYIRMFLNHFDNKAMRTLRIRTSGSSRTRVDWLTPEDTQRVFDMPMTRRQSVIISAGFLQGMRRVETLRMTVKDARGAVDSGILRVRGKGHKERAVPIHEHFQQVLRNFLREVDPDQDATPLLKIHRTKSEEDLADFCVRFGKKFAFHTMRRTFGRNLWLQGVRLETISELLGHASIDMTRYYLGLNLLDMKQALGLYKVTPADLTPHEASRPSHSVTAHGGLSPRT